MAEQPDSYEDLTQCGLDDDNEAELLQIQRECTFMWTNKKGEAFGVIMSFLPKDGKLWLILDKLKNAQATESLKKESESKKEANKKFL